MYICKFDSFNKSYILNIHIHTCTHTYIPTLNKVRASRPSSQISSEEHICNLKGSDGRLTEQQKFYKFGFLKHLIFIHIRNVITFEYIGNSLQGKVWQPQIKTSFIILFQTFYLFLISPLFNQR